MLAIRDTVSFELKDSFIDQEGRYIILVINNLPITLVSVYAPNSHQIRFLRKVFKKVFRVRVGSLLLCGDFNVIVDGQLDSISSVRSQSHYFRDLLIKEELYDVWRCLNANEKSFTYYSPRHNSYSRIDLFLADRYHPPLSMISHGLIMHRL